MPLNVRRSWLNCRSAQGDWVHLGGPLTERMVRPSMDKKRLGNWLQALSRGDRRKILMGASLVAVMGIWLLSSGCAATTGAAGAALGYGLTGNARGAALGAGAGILAGSMFDAGLVRPYHYPGPYYGPGYYAPYYPGRWVRVPGHWDYFGRWIPPHTKWVPY